MPEFKLKDRDGKEQTYNRDVITVPGTNGEKVKFIFPNFAELEITENGEYSVPEGVDGYTKVKANVPVPTLISGAEFELDFSNGDIHITAPDGYAFTGGTIKKPETLVPENIAKDVEVAGIVGTHEGGGSTVAGTVTITFCNYDGTELFSRLVFVGDNCPDPVEQGKINEPTRESTAQYTYTYNGWSLTKGGAASASALNVVTGDRTVYAAYTQNVRYYTVRFWNGSVLDQESTWAYGSTPAYQGGAPVPEEGYAFDRWLPEISVVTGDMDYVAQFKSIKSLTRDILTRTITQYANDTIIAVGQYAFLECTALASVNIPNVTSIGLGAFRDCTTLTNVNMPNVTSIGMYAFDGCQKLTSVDLLKVTYIDSYAFQNCKILKSIRLPATPPSLNNTNAFNGIAGFKLYIPAGSLAAYRSASRWKNLSSDTFIEEDR